MRSVLLFRVLVFVFGGWLFLALSGFRVWVSGVVVCGFWVWGLAVCGSFWFEGLGLGGGCLWLFLVWGTLGVLVDPTDAQLIASIVGCAERRPGTWCLEHSWGLCLR